MTSVSIANPAHALGTFTSKVIGIGLFGGAVVVAPSEGSLGHSDSMSKQILGLSTELTRQ